MTWSAVPSEVIRGVSYLKLLTLVFDLLILGPNFAATKATTSRMSDLLQRSQPAVRCHRHMSSSCTDKILTNNTWESSTSAVHGH